MGAEAKQGPLNDSQEVSNGQVTPEKIQELFEDLDALRKKIGNDKNLLKLARDDDGKIDLNMDGKMSDNEKIDIDGDDDFDMHDIDSPKERETLKNILLKVQSVEGLYKWIKESNDKVDNEKIHRELTSKINTETTSLKENKISKKISSQHKTETDLQNIFNAGRNISTQNITEYDTTLEQNKASDSILLESKDTGEESLKSDVSKSKDNYGIKNDLCSDLKKNYLGGAKVESTYKNALKYGDKIQTSSEKIGKSEEKMGTFFATIREYSETNSKEIKDITKSKKSYDESITANNQTLTETKALVPKIQESLDHANSSIDMLSEQIQQGQKLAESITTDILEDSSNTELKDLLKRVIEKNATLKLKKAFAKTAQKNYKAELSNLNVQISVIIGKVNQEKTSSKLLKERIKTLQDAFIIKIKELQKSIEAEKKIINTLLSWQENHIENIEAATNIIDEYNDKLKEKEVKARRELQKIKNESKEQFESSDKSQLIKGLYNTLTTRISSALKDDNLNLEKRFFGYRDSEFKDIQDAKESFDEAILRSEGRIDVAKVSILKKVKEHLIKLNKNPELSNLLIEHYDITNIEVKSLKEIKKSYSSIVLIEEGHKQISFMRKKLQAKINKMDIEERMSYQKIIDKANKTIYLFESSIEKGTYTEKIYREIYNVRMKLTPELGKLGTFMGGINDITDGKRVMKSQKSINENYKKILKIIGNNNNIKTLLDEKFDIKTGFKAALDYKKGDMNIQKSEVDEIRSQSLSIQKISSLIDKYLIPEKKRLNQEKIKLKKEENQKKQDTKKINSIQGGITYLTKKIERIESGLELALEDGTSAKEMEELFKVKSTDLSTVWNSIERNDALDYYDLIKDAGDEDDALVLIGAARKYGSSSSSELIDKMVKHPDYSNLGTQTYDFDMQLQNAIHDEKNEGYKEGSHKLAIARLQEGNLSPDKKAELVALMKYGKENGIDHTKLFYMNVRIIALGAESEVEAFVNKITGLEKISQAEIKNQETLMINHREKLSKLFLNFANLNNYLGVKYKVEGGAVAGFMNKVTSKNTYKGVPTKVQYLQSPVFTGETKIQFKTMKKAIQGKNGAPLREILINNASECKKSNGEDAYALLKVAQQIEINNIIDSDIDKKLSDSGVYDLLILNNDTNKEKLVKKVKELGGFLATNPCITEQQKEFKNLFDGLLDSEKLKKSPRIISEIFGVSIDIEVKKRELQITDLEREFDTLTEIDDIEKKQVFILLSNINKGTSISNIPGHIKTKLFKLGLSQIETDKKIQTIILSIINHKKTIAGLNKMKANISVLDKNIWSAFLDNGKKLSREDIETYLNNLPFETKEALKKKKESIVFWLNKELDGYNKLAKVSQGRTDSTVRAASIIQSESDKKKLEDVQSTAKEESDNQWRNAGITPQSTSNNGVSPITVEGAIKQAKDGMDTTSRKKILSDLNKSQQAAKKEGESSSIRLNQAIAADLPHLWQPLDKDDYPNTSKDEIDRMNTESVSVINRTQPPMVFGGDNNIPNGRLVTEGGRNYIYHGNNSGNQSLIAQNPNDDGSYDSVLIGADGKRLIVSISQREKDQIKNIEGASQNIFNFYEFFDNVGLGESVTKYKNDLLVAYGTLNISTDGMMDKAELLKFSNFILSIFLGKNDKRSKSTSLSFAMLHLRSLTQYHISDDIKKGLNSEDLFEHTLRKTKIIGTGLGFNIEALRNAQINGGILELKEKQK